MVDLLWSSLTNKLDLVYVVIVNDRKITNNHDARIVLKHTYSRSDKGLTMVEHDATSACKISNKNTSGNQE